MNQETRTLTPVEILVSEQYRRWEQAIEDFEFVMPLWYRHAVRMKLTPAQGWCKTAATDGLHLYFNPVFSKNLTDQELQFVLMHEVFHVAYGHIWRGVDYIKVEGKEPPYIDPADKEQQRKNAEKWNRAADYAIHGVMVPLVEGGEFPSMAVPKNLLYDRAYLGFSAEEIFPLLPDKEEVSLDLHIFRGLGEAPDGAMSDAEGNWVLIVDQNGNPINTNPNQTPGVGDPNDNGSISGAGLNPVPVPLTPEEFQDLMDAVQEAFQEGAPPPGMMSADNIRNPEDVDPRYSREDWRSILAQFCLLRAKSDYSYTRPSRRYLVNFGLVLPGLVSELLEGVIVIDTSGSIGQRELSRFFSELVAIRGQLPDHILHVIACDSSVKAYTRIESGQQLDYSTVGGGGTAFGPAFKEVEDRGLIPDFLLYFTDGQNYDKNIKEPSYPVLWALYGEYQKQPWGQNIVIKDN